MRVGVGVPVADAGVFISTGAFVLKLLQPAKAIAAARTGPKYFFPINFVGFGANSLLANSLLINFLF
ncbi:MAG: hypothetical protein HY425_02535 [Candidatus Levybacteria bacterium]|nr:hypothetical protein [Candidatus Levybacteria bacterium]